MIFFEKYRSVGLSTGRVVGDVRVAAPDGEAASGLQHPDEVVEPGAQHLVERFPGHEVVGQGQSLARSFLPVGFAFSG